MNVLEMGNGVFAHLLQVSEELEEFFEVDLSVFQRKGVGDDGVESLVLEFGKSLFEEGYN